MRARIGPEETAAHEVRALHVQRLGLLPYGKGLELQDSLTRERRAGSIPDQLLLLEHPHVITMGTGSSSSHILADENRRGELGVELFETGRGGDVTYHGPGQLVGYPILDLKPDRKDLHRYLRDLEEVLIQVLRSYGIEGSRSTGFTGVWTWRGKVGAIGVRVSSGWITSHGFALNVNTNLDYFGTIIPCGIRDRQVASLQSLLGETRPMEEVMDRTALAMARVFGRQLREAPAGR